MVGKFRSRALAAVAAVALVAAVAARTVAQEKAPDAKQLERARKYLEVSGAVGQLRRQLDNMTARMTAGARDPEAAKRWRDTFKVEELLDLMAPVYAKRWSAEDLDAAIAFWESEPGKRLVQSLPAVTKECEEATDAYFRERLESPDGPLGGARKMGNEAAAIGALKTIATSQSIFREGDKDNDGALDYGSLEELGKAELIDKVLASGKKQGYLFRCGASPTTSEFLWWATAFPEKPGVSGERFFFTNQAGVLYYSREEFAVDKDTCKVPEGLKPVGR